MAGGSLAFTSAFPAMVAPMNSQNGMRKCPQQIPHRSKSAFGQAASRKMPQKPCLHARKPQTHAVQLHLLHAHLILHTPKRHHSAARKEAQRQCSWWRLHQGVPCPPPRGASALSSTQCK